MLHMGLLRASSSMSMTHGCYRYAALSVLWVVSTAVAQQKRH